MHASHTRFANKIRAALMTQVGQQPKDNAKQNDHAAMRPQPAKGPRHQLRSSGIEFLRSTAMDSEVTEARTSLDSCGPDSCAALPVRAVAATRQVLLLFHRAYQARRCGLTGMRTCVIDTSVCGPGIKSEAPSCDARSLGIGIHVCIPTVPGETTLLSANARSTP